MVKNKQDELKKILEDRSKKLDKFVRKGSDIPTPNRIQSPLM